MTARSSKGALLDDCGPGTEGEEVLFVERGGRLDPGIGCEIGDRLCRLCTGGPSSVRQVVCLRRATSERSALATMLARIAAVCS